MASSRLRYLGALLLASVLSVLATAPAFAEFKLLDWIEEFGDKRFMRATPPRLKAGPVIFHPTLRTEVAYNDNILLEPFDRREDVLFNVIPGVVLEIPYDTHQLMVAYEADFETFVKRSKENDQNQNFFSLLDLNFPTWYVNVLERLVETSSRSGTPFTDRIPRIDHVVHPKIGYRWKRMTFEAGYRHFMRDFRRQVQDPINFQSNEWAGVVYVDLLARLKALLEYSWAQIDYDDNFRRNGTFQTLRVGLEGEIWPNLFVKLRAGPHFRDYHEFYKPDYKSWIASALAEYQFRENLKLEAEFHREMAESTLTDVNFYREHLYRVGVEYGFLPLWTVFSSARYYRHSYTEPALSDGRLGLRRDNHVRMTAGLRYLFREWWEFEAAYDYLRRDSNFASSDYTDHRFSLSSSIFY